jgi:DNA polymerase-3 subunit alpha (Gram-positive type)
MQYIVFDLETTGLSPFSGDRICEIGAVKIVDGKISDKFWSLVNPERELSFSAYRVNRITSEMLESAPKMSEVLPEFLNFITGTKLAAYNAGFDLSFLNMELRKLGMDIIPDEQVIDIYILAKKLLPHLGFYPLWNVAKNLNVTVNASHRALADAIVAAEVFIKLLAQGGEEMLERAHMDYHKNRKLIIQALKERRNIKIKFGGDEGEILEQVIMPLGISEELGQEILEYQVEDKKTKVPLNIIMEVD